MPSLTRRAFAKVNLALSVGPPEPPGSPRPGWHPICSWMHAIDLADDLIVESTTGGSVHEIAWAKDAPRPAPIDWPIDSDLAVRAHRLLESEAGQSLPVHLRLSKRIPVGAGLGGGSSDAAAALLAINALFNLQLSVARLRDLSSRLGSDVAFFLDDFDPPRAAIVSGFGDRIERLDARRTEWLVLIMPPLICPTPAVYRAYDTAPRPLDQPRVHALAHRPRADTLHLFNDLEAAAAAIAPGLSAIRAAATLAARHPVHMTGSGSGLFIIAPDAASASTIAAEVAATLARRATAIAVLPVRLI